MPKILVLTDMDSTGSGYKNICLPLLTGLVGKGYDIKVAGLFYTGEEHNHPFSIIPALDVQAMAGIANNMIYMWQPDVILVAMDLNLQGELFARLSGFKIPYIAITPLENGPLSMSWAAPLFNMDAVFFISELGKQEAIKSGVMKAEHLLIGVDTVSWHPATPEEKKRLRDGLGIPQDAFVVLTVADNQERKNLWAGMAAISMLTHEGLTESDIVNNTVRKFPKTRDDVKYILVTRENSRFGWNLRDLSVSLDIVQEYMPFERGMPQKDLWALYAVADVYLQPSKAEGLGLPVMDAMCCKVPVIATDTGALTELLDSARGLLVRPFYVFGDVWGNSRRAMIDVEEVSDTFKYILGGHFKDNISRMIHDAYDYIEDRTWDIPVTQVHKKIEEILEKRNEQKTSQ